jgi:acyl carrier protein
MSSPIVMLQEGLHELFPEMGEMIITPDTKLHEIPDWDSMSSVNLQVYLEENFNIIVHQNFLNDDTSVAEILSLMQFKEAA